MIHRFTRPTLALLFAVGLASTASAQQTTELVIDGSSGKYFPEQPAACQAAKDDALGAATRECERKMGTAGEPTYSDCECEQGGFESSEWLCSAKATLSCAATGKEPPKPMTPTAGPMKLEFQIADTLQPLEMLAGDFNRRGLSLPRSAIAGRYKAMCDGGWPLACEASSWHDDGMSSLEKGADAFTRACKGGDQAACIAEGWSHEAAAQKANDAEEYKAAARRYKDLCDSDKNQYACYEYGAILFNNLGVTADPRLGIRRWEGACDEGEGAACTVLARIWFDGVKVKADAEKAKGYANKACSAGDPHGCYEQARIGGKADAMAAKQTELCQKGGVDACWAMASSYLSGERPEPSKGTARSLLDLGCELGHAQSCSAAATAALADADDATAAKLYRRACMSNDITSCTGLVDLIVTERTDGSVKQDRYAFEVACSRGGNATACSVLGLALLEGESLKKDTARARSLLKQSCIDKTSPARPCFVLGDLYETGAGGERDRTLAATYYKWACAQGWGEACDRRGDLLDQGVGVAEDDAEAVASYQLGCDAGFPNACHKAAVILDEGTNIPRDAKRALGLYDMGCEKGVGEACLRLGKLYVEGAGTDKDEAKARDAFEKAVALKNVEAHRRLARLLWFGLGGKKDKKRAKALCAAGCQADDPIACRGPAWQTEGSN
ncbi:MAG: sel1 repeat family protein [Alphaproteobacteria bacterium]|nr:sel1 repeat family protein [Alphaproteobacteria bacterium]